MATEASPVRGLRRIALPVAAPLFEALERHLSGDARAGEDAVAGVEFKDGVAALSHANLQDGVMAVLELAQDGKRYRVDVTVLQRRRTGSIFLLAKRAGLETLRKPVRVDTALGPFELVIVSSQGS
ncbi:MAG TPA: hypothetical protein VIL18_02420 [Longimicrobiales bacterium]